MTTLEILLLILGVVVFVASFIIPETQGEMDEVDKQLTKEQIQEILKEEMKNVHEQVNDVIDETVTYSVEKSERALERLTNDKMQAISEYSGTVLEDIHKNHEETMFLYDMLNDKHENLKEVASEVSLAVKQANEAVLEMQNSSEQAKVAIEEAMDEAIGEAISAAKEEAEFVPIMPEQMEQVSSNQAIGMVNPFVPEMTQEMTTAQTQQVVDAGNERNTVLMENDVSLVKESSLVKEEAIDIEEVQRRSMEDMDLLREVLKPANAKKIGNKKVTKSEPKKTAKKASAKRDATNIAISFDGLGANANNNEEILRMHNQGKSNMAIAKQLGLGIGEVNLVIALYEENGV